MLIPIDALKTEFRSALLAKLAACSDQAAAIDAAWSEAVTPKLAVVNERLQTMAGMSFTSGAPRHLGGRESQFGR